MANTARRDSARIGVIDLGSNTVLLLVLERSGRVVHEDARITRLGQGVFSSGRLRTDAVERTRASVREFASRARELGARRVVGVGTEALRRSEQGSEFLSGLCGGGVLDTARLLSAEEEAAFAIEASRRVAPAGEASLVIDVGGGSTELAWTDLAGGVHAASLPLGSVRLTESLLSSHPVPDGDLEAARASVRECCATLARLAPRVHGPPIAVAGTATSLAALDLRLEPYDAARVEGHALSRAGLAEWIDTLAPRSIAERRRLPGLEPGRADVIVAGLLILQGVLGALGSDEFRVSGRGVRHGVALRLLDADPPF